MNRQFRGGIIYLVIILVVMYFIMSFSSFGKTGSSYGYGNFISDIEAGNISKVEISQNSEVPTGTVKVTFTESSRNSERFNVPDVNDITSLVIAYDSVKLVVNDVEREHIFNDNSSIPAHSGCDDYGDTDNQQTGRRRWRRG